MPDRAQLLSLTGRERGYAALVERLRMGIFHAVLLPMDVDTT